MREPSTPRTTGRWALILLVVPFIGLLFPQWYAHADPRLGGIPFYLWYQFLWVFIGVGITGFVYFATRGGDHE